MTQLVRLTTIAAKTADQKPATRKPGRNQATSMIISALMTSRKRPSVSNVIGRVRMMMIGRTKALTTPSSSAAAINVPVELNATQAHLRREPKADRDDSRANKEPFHGALLFQALHLAIGWSSARANP